MGSQNTFITHSQLIDALADGLQPVVFDVRKRPAFEESDRMIAGAVWRDPAALDTWIDQTRDRGRIVVYCVHGHEVSQGAAEALRAAGIDAVYLQGGFEDFADAGGPTVGKPGS